MAMRTFYLINANDHYSVRQDVIVVKDDVVECICTIHADGFQGIFSKGMNLVGVMTLIEEFNLGEIKKGSFAVCRCGSESYHHIRTAECFAQIRLRELSVREVSDLVLQAKRLEPALKLAELLWRATHAEPSPRSGEGGEVDFSTEVFDRLKQGS